MDSLASVLHLTFQCGHTTARTRSLYLRASLILTAADRPFTTELLSNQ